MHLLKMTLIKSLPEQATLKSLVCSFSKVNFVAFTYIGAEQLALISETEECVMCGRLCL